MGKPNKKELSVDECMEIFKKYDVKLMVQKEKPGFINGKVKEILDKCNIKTVVDGIGWRIA